MSDTEDIDQVEGE
ncbi:unnamed protein product [Ophioblennius macclurei]